MIKIADALNIEVFELLKPETIIPDDFMLLLENYTADIHRVFGDTVDKIREIYLEQLKKKLLSKQI